MATDKNARRLPLRQLLTHTEKHNRDLAELLHSDLTPKIADLHELSQPVRRRGQYPTVTALGNALGQLGTLGSDFLKRLDEFLEELDAIRDHANRDRIERRH